MKTVQPKPPVSYSQSVPFWQKMAYGCGSALEMTAFFIPQANLVPVFSTGLGLSPSIIALVLMCWRLSDGVTDQIMGNVSDNARTRWGRRRPFIVVGAFLTALTMPLLWWFPAGLSVWQIVTWLVISGSIFYTCFSVWAMPYYSLQLEMSADYDERTNISAYRAYMGQFFQLGAGWIPALAAMPSFSRLAEGKPDLLNGMREISIGLALLTFGLGVLPGLFVKERYYEEVSAQPKQRLLDSLKQTFSSKPFLWILVIVFTKTFGLSLVGTMGFYVNLYYICRGDLRLATVISGGVGTALLLPCLLAIPLCTWISSRWDKKVLLYVTAIGGIVGSLSSYLLFTPAHPWLQVIPPLLIGPIGLGIWILVPSMQADVADHDELMGGLRREGSFSAVFSWSLKATIALSGGLSGIIVVLLGFDIKQGVNQAPYVLENLKLFYIWIPVVFLLFSLAGIYCYPLTREKMKEIRQKLEERRGVV